MKNPIIEDFDPKSRTRQLSSPLDGMPSIEKPRPRPPVTKPDSAPIEPVSPRVPEPRRSAPKTASTTGPSTRTYVRRTFDIYDDQLAYLTRASLQDRLNGGERSMNSMVRAAIDAYIEKHRKK